MNFKSLGFLLVSLLFSMTNFLISQPTKVTFNVRGWNKELLYPSRIELNELGDTTKQVYYNKNNNKEFSLNLKNKEFYLVRVSGVYHLTDSLLLFVPDNSVDILVNVYLEPIVPNSASIPTLILRGEKTENAKFFKKVNENLYEIEIQTTPNKQICYEVGGIYPNRYINGTFAEVYLYDGGGDWWSCFDAKANNTKIILELGKYPKVWNEFGFTINNKVSEEIASFYRNSLTLRNKIINFNRTKKGPIENLPDTLVEQITFYLDFLKNTWERNKTKEIIENLIFIDYLTFSYILFKFNEFNSVDKTFLKKVYEVVPPTSKLWLDFAEQPGLILAGLLILNSPDSVDYVDKVLSFNQSEFIKRKLARDAIDLYFSFLGRQDLGEKYYSYLINNYPNSEEALYAIRNYPKLNADSLYLNWKEIISNYDLQPLFSNEKLKLSSFGKSKKYILLELWATWCGPCLKQIPVLTDAFNKYKDKLEIISISFDSNVEVLKQFIKKKQEKGQMLWFQAIEPSGFSSQLAKGLSIKGIPFSLLFDENLNIIATTFQLNEYNLLNTLEKLIK